MNDLTSIITNVRSFPDVQRALEELKKALNFVKEKQNPSPELGESQLDGDVGSIRVISNNNEDALFEIKTEEGWKRPVVGNTPVTFGEVASISKTKTKRSIDEIETNDIETEGNVAKKTIFDEKADKFILARPDYISPWIWFDYSSHVCDSSVPWEYAHDLGMLPTLIQVQVAYAEDGNPTSGTDEEPLEDQNSIVWYTGFNNNFSDSEATARRYGAMWHVTSSKIIVQGARSLTAKGFFQSSGNNVSYEDCSIRILMWK